MPKFKITKSMTAKLSPQAELVLNVLSQGRSVTTQVMMNTHGIASLTSRIAELRKAGFAIEGKWKSVPEKHNRRYMAYKLVGLNR